MKKDERGFTLVELVIVIGVIGILGAVLIPVFCHITEEAEKTVDKQTMIEINTKLKTGEITAEGIERYEIRTKGWRLAYNEKENEVAIVDKEGKIVASINEKSKGKSMEEMGYKELGDSEEEEEWWEKLEPVKEIEGEVGEEIRISDEMTSEELGEKLRGTGIRRIYIGKGIDRIPENAFNGCKELEEVKITECTQGIGKSAFEKCESIEKIDLSEVKAIEGYAFYECTKLREVKMSKVTTIGKYAFGSCKGIKEIEIPETIEEVECSAFNKCEMTRMKMRCAKIQPISESVGITVNFTVENMEIDGGEIEGGMSAYILGIISNGSEKLKTVTVRGITVKKGEAPFGTLKSGMTLNVADEESYNALVTAAGSESKAKGDATLVKLWL